MGTRLDFSDTVIPHNSANPPPHSSKRNSIPQTIQQRNGAMHVITPAIFLAALLIFIWRVVAVTLLYSASIGVIIALINAPIVALGNSTGVGYWIGHAVNSRFGSAPLFLAREALTYCQDNIFLLPYPGYPGTEQAAELWALRPQYEHSPIESLADPHISGAIYRYGWALRRCDLFGT